MKRYTFFIAALLIVGLCGTAAAQKTHRLTAEFSDPDRPGTLNLEWFRGDITIGSGKAKNVTISVSKKLNNPNIGTDFTILKGKRVYTPPVEILEEDNVMDITSKAEYGNYTISIGVPEGTNLNVKNSTGNIIIQSDEHPPGEINVECDHGDITLYHVVGPATVNTQYGDIKVEFLKIDHTEPMSFVTGNNDISIILPGDIAADFLLNSQDFIATDLPLELNKTDEGVREFTINFEPEIKVQAVIKEEIEKKMQELQVKKEEMVGKVHVKVDDKQNVNFVLTTDKEGKVFSIVKPMHFAYQYMYSGDLYKLNGGGVLISAHASNGSIVVRKKY